MSLTCNIKRGKFLEDSSFHDEPQNHTERTLTESLRSQQESNPAEKTWKRTRLRFRALALLVSACLGLPGNIFVLYFYYFADAKDESVADKNLTEVYEDEKAMPCYESVDEAESYLEKWSFWIEGILLITTGSIGLLGNIVSFLVLRQDMKKTPFNSYLKKLSAVDSAFLVCSIFDNGYSSLTSGDFPSWYSILYPYVFHPLKTVFMTASIYMIVAMAVDRHYAVKHPMKFRPGSDFATVVVAGISVCYSLPKYFEFKVVREEDNLHFWTTSLNEYPKYIVFNSYMELLVTGVLPLTILCLINAFIYAKIRQSSVMVGKYVVSGNNNSARSRRRRRLLRLKTEKSIGILLGIVMAFLVCQSLRLVIQLFEIMTPTHSSAIHYEHCINQGKLHIPTYVFLLVHFNHWLLVLNSSVNIFIYFYSSRTFQKGFLKLCHGALKCLVLQKGNDKPSVTIQNLSQEQGLEEETHV